jgi:DNA-binding MarR family transcriptional regulator
MGKKAKARDKERRKQAAAEAAAPVMTSLATRLDTVAIHLLRRLAREDAAMGLTSVRLSALAVLVSDGPITLGALAHSERVTAPSMTRLVTAMETDGLVERIPSAQDGRQVFVRATPRGAELLGTAREVRAAALSGWLLPVGPDGLRCIDEATVLLEQVLRDETG